MAVKTWSEIKRQRFSDEKIKAIQAEVAHELLEAVAHDNRVLPSEPLIPNEVTTVAMNEARRGNLPRSASAQTLLNDLNADEVDDDVIGDETRAKLDVALDRSMAQAEHGETRPASEVLAELRQRHQRVSAGAGEVESQEQRQRAIENMSARRWTLPADYQSDRDEANERHPAKAR